MAIGSMLLHEDPKKQTRKPQPQPQARTDYQEYVRNPGPDKPFKQMTGLEYMKYCEDRGV